MFINSSCSAFNKLFSIFSINNSKGSCLFRGCGIDIVEIIRIERLIEKYQRAFLNKVFTASEIEYCRKKARPSVHFAGRWAVKEAFYKAVPTECQPVSTWHSIQILSHPSGKPEIHILSDALKSALQGCAIEHYHTSISHERNYCVAQVYLVGKN